MIRLWIFMQIYILENIIKRVESPYRFIANPQISSNYCLLLLKNHVIKYIQQCALIN